jgi:hypothetical protein
MGRENIELLKQKQGPGCIFLDQAPGSKSGSTNPGSGKLRFPPYQIIFEYIGQEMLQIFFLSLQTWRFRFHWKLTAIRRKYLALESKKRCLVAFF